MRIVEGIVEKARKQQSNAAASAQPQSRGQSTDFRHELTIDGCEIEIELNDNSHELNEGHRVVVAGFQSENILTGYAYENFTTSQGGQTGSGGLAFLFGLILIAGAIAALATLIFTYTDLAGKTLLIFTALLLLNLGNFIAGQPIRAWLAVRAIDRFKEQNMRYEAE